MFLCESLCKLGSQSFTEMSGTFSRPMYSCRAYSQMFPTSKKYQFRPLKLPYDNSVVQARGPYVQAKGREGPKREVSSDVDWSAVWPVARTFQPDIINIPIRQGYTEKRIPKFSKDCSVELLKIPNFLHLSPVAIKKHCEAIKKFCTKWPTELESENVSNQHFPVEIISSDYCYASPSIRDPEARIITVKLGLSSLKLDAHAKDKFLRLVGERYDPSTDTVTIVADRCPTRKQNLEHAKYILTALYHESKNIEPWESEKSKEDMEYYDWETSGSRRTLEALYQWSKPNSRVDYKEIPHVDEYKDAISDIINQGEDREKLDRYRKAVEKLLGINRS